MKPRAGASPQALLRQIPKVDRVLLEPAVVMLVERYGRAPVVAAVREITESLRDAVLGGLDSIPMNGELVPHVCDELAQRLAAGARKTLRPAINATGVVLHTGLGRARLPDAAADAIASVARSHSLLEVDPETGERGSRLAHVDSLLRELTGAEAALVVNNCAAAVFLAIAALAAGREVIIARGQLVEIGGSFRMPDVIRAAGARLVEVGTTNKVRLSDYASAITPETALLLRVHPSNFRIIGFTEEPPLEALAELARERTLPLMDDLGSGALIDLTRFGLTSEPTVPASIAAGADILTFSGDKLLGGPQAGIVLGKSELLARMKRHPLMRVLRVDKLTMTGLEATLRLYRDEPTAMARIPTLAALSAAPEEIETRAARLAGLLASLPARVSLEAGASQVGGGSLPGEELPTTLVTLEVPDHGVSDLARRLRTGNPSVWGRVQRDRLLLDVRTVTDDELPQLARALSAALAPEGERDQWSG